MWASFYAIFTKEFLHVRRDRGTLIAAFSIPIFQIILFGFIDQNVKNLPTVVVDQDQTSYSRHLIDELTATRTFAIENVTNSSPQARADIVSGRARVGIVIPPDFHDQRARGRTAKILVLIDGSDSTASSQALASVNGLIAQDGLAVMTQNARATGSPELPLAAQPIILFNPEGRTANYILPGLVAILLQIVALVLVAVAIVREREKGTLEQLLVTPINTVGLMLGKLTPYLILGLAEMAVVLFIMRWGFDVPIQGNIPFLFGMAVIYLFALLSMGLFISSRAQTQAQAQQLAQLFLLPSIFLSGYIFPAAGLPKALYYIGRVLPATHMIAIMRGVVLRDASVWDLAPNVLALVAISIVLVWGSVSRFRKVAF